MDVVSVPVILHDERVVELARRQRAELERLLTPVALAELDELERRALDAVLGVNDA